MICPAGLTTLRYVGNVDDAGVKPRIVGQGASQRQLRVGEEIRHALASVLVRDELRDPDLIGCSVTVTEVRPTPDLRQATVFVVPFGGGDAESLLVALNRAASFLQHRVGQMVRLKFVPRLSFRLDGTFDNAERIRSLLDKTGMNQRGDTGADE